MKKLTVVALAVAMGAMLVPAVAQADTIKHRGKITGVPGTEVKFGVKKQNGDLKNISNMTFKAVPVACDDGTSGAITAELPQFPVRGKDFTRKGKIEGVGIENGFLRVSGEFSGGGKRASGKIRISFKSAAGAGCGTDDVGWKTRKK